jgi:hypothetical protein
MTNDIGVMAGQRRDQAGDSTTTSTRPVRPALQSHTFPGRELEALLRRALGVAWWSVLRPCIDEKIPF